MAWPLSDQRVGELLRRIAVIPLPSGRTIDESELLALWNVTDHELDWMQRKGGVPLQRRLKCGKAKFSLVDLNQFIADGCMKVDRVQLEREAITDQLRNARNYAVNQIACKSPCPPPTDGKVYFVREARDGIIKIGWTKKSLRERIKHLQIGNPFKLSPAACIYGVTDAVEKMLHRRFDHLNVSGEWFFPNDDMREIMKEYPVVGESRRRP